MAQAFAQHKPTSMPDNKSSSSSGYVPKSDYAYYKDFGGFNNFMHSYGLKPYDHNDIQEGKAIIEGFREQDRYEWEQKQKESQK